MALLYTMLTLDAETKKLDAWFQTQVGILKQQADGYIKAIKQNWPSRQKIQARSKIIEWHRIQMQNLAKTRDESLRALTKKHSYEEQHNMKKKAVLVGINYVGTRNELRGCVNDVYKIKEILITKFGYNPRNITLILDANATRKNILEKFTELVQNAEEGDNICFTFSGHGCNIKDMNGDETTGQDEVIVSVDNYAIVDDEFKQILQTKMKSNVTLFAMFDSCHSGTVLDLRYEYFVDETKIDSMNPNSIDTPGQVILISGCKDSQISIDAQIGKNFTGALTFAFAETLSFGGSGTWSGFFQHIRKVLAHYKMEQIPQFSSGRHIDISTEPMMI